MLLELCAEFPPPKGICRDKSRKEIMKVKKLAIG